MVGCGVRSCQRNAGAGFVVGCEFGQQRGANVTPVGLPYAAARPAGVVCPDEFDRARRGQPALPFTGHIPNRLLPAKINLPHLGADHIHKAVSRLYSLACPSKVRACFALLILAGVFTTLQPVAASVPEYKLGDVATEDVITPVPLVVLNPEATDALKERVSQQAPSIVRFTPQTATEVEAELRGMIASAHTKFITALDALQDHPPTAADIGTPVYTAAFEYTAHNFVRSLPLEKLAAIWLRRENEQAFVDSLVKPLREVMALPVIAGAELDAGLPTGPTMRLVTVKNINAPAPIETLEAAGQTMPATRLVTVARAQQVIQNSFPAGQQQLGEFVASFVHPNAFYDAASTEVVRAKRTVSLAVNDTFEAAQVIVHKGQTIDRRALSALAVLREKSLIGTLQNKLAQEQTVAGQIKSQTIWIAAGLGVMGVALVLILLRLRSRTSTAIVPVGDPSAAAAGGEGVWQTRALIAEDKAERAHEAIRSGALGWMRDKFFRAMFHQREELLTAQKTAEVEMQEFEQRLEQLQAPLQERHAAYEKRIADLEQELAAKTAAAAANVPAPSPAPAPVVAPHPLPPVTTSTFSTTVTPTTVPLFAQSIPSAIPAATLDEIERNNRRELELRLKQLQTPFQQQIREYESRIGDLEQQLASSHRPSTTARSIFARPNDPDRNVQRREATLAEREQAIAEAEQRVAERARDLNELDALLRAREALIASQSARPTSEAAAAKLKGAEALKQFRTQLGLPEQPVNPAVSSQTPH